MAEMDQVDDTDHCGTVQLSLADILYKISQKILNGSEESFEDLGAHLSVETVNQLLQEAVTGDKAIAGGTSENLVVMEFLIQRGADVDYKDLTGPYPLTILHHAVGRGLCGEVKLLIEKGANVNALCNEPATDLRTGPDDPDFPESVPVPAAEISCLMLAIYKEDVDMTELLLLHGADLPFAVRLGALNCCVEQANFPLLKCLVAHGADVGQVVEKTDDGRPIVLVDKLFQNACYIESLLRTILRPSVTDGPLGRGAASVLAEHQRCLDCLKFILSEKAPTVTEEGLSCFSTLSDALRDGCFLTICHLYFYCVTNGIPVIMPDVLPQISQAEPSFLVPSGPSILAKMLRNWPPMGNVSNKFIAGLETFAGMIPENPGAQTLKNICISRIRLSLHKSTCNFQCLDRLQKLELPPSLRAAITMKDLNDHLEEETRMAQELSHLFGPILASITAFINIENRCLDYLEADQEYIGKVIANLEEIRQKVSVTVYDQLEPLFLLNAGDIKRHFDNERNATAEEFDTSFQKPIDHIFNTLDPLMVRFKKVCDSLLELQPVLVDNLSPLLDLYENCQKKSSRVIAVHQQHLVQKAAVDKVYVTLVKSIPVPST